MQQDSHRNWQTQSIDTNSIITQSQMYSLDSPGNCTLLIKQLYTKLFYDPTQKLTVLIDSVVITFYDSSKADQTNYVCKVAITNKDVTVMTNYIPKIGNQNGYEETSQPEPIKIAIFPQGTSQAKNQLFKRLWFQVNRLQNSLKINVGDLANFDEHPILNYSFDYQHIERNTWQKSEDQFPPPSTKVKSLQQKQNGGYRPPYDPSNPRMKNLLSNARFFTIKINTKNIGDIQSKQRIQDYLRINYINSVNIYNPVLQANPSILKPHVAPLANMPSQIQLLYSYLQNLNVETLPDFNANPDERGDREEYLGFKYFNNAVQFSLTTPYRRQDKRPIGILNHLYMMKYSNYMKKQPEIICYNDFMQVLKKQKFKDNQEMLNYIYKNRQGYLRLQLLAQAGIAPGSMAVMQLWPPFSCSMIHDHGDAYGVIKVCSGSIQVQNFNQLTFADLPNNPNNIQPYQKLEYTKGQYTWLSSYSFAIHRLLNLRSQTCINLQSYLQGENTNEFFSFVDKASDPDSKSNAYYEFYPQNDWQNYLNFPEEYKANKQKYCLNKDLIEKEVDFIKDVRDKYGLYNNDGTINTEFYKLCLTLKKQYEFGDHYKPEKQSFLNSVQPLENKQNILYWITDKSKCCENLTQRQKEELQSQPYGYEVIQIDSQHTFKNKYLSINHHTYHSHNIIIAYGCRSFDNQSMNLNGAIDFFKNLQYQGNVLYNHGIVFNNAKYFGYLMDKNNLRNVLQLTNQKQKQYTNYQLFKQYLDNISKNKNQRQKEERERDAKRIQEEKKKKEEKECKKMEEPTKN